MSLWAVEHWDYRAGWLARDGYLFTSRAQARRNQAWFRTNFPGLKSRVARYVRA